MSVNGNMTGIESEKNSNTQRVLLISFTVALLLILIPLSILPHIFGDVHLINIPLHSGLEAFGAISSFVLGIVLLISVEHKHIYRWRAPLGMGFILMGVFDGLHSISPIGEAFVLLHTLAMLIGSICFLGVFASKSWIQKYLSFKIIYAVWIASAFIGVLIFFNVVPIINMLQGNSFTFTATLMNVFSGICFFCVAVFLHIKFWQEKDISTYLIGLIVSLSAIAGLTFYFSDAWCYSWWIWHLARVLSFTIALFLMLLYLRQAIIANRLLLLEKTQLSGLLENKNIELKKLLYIASHDLRSPLVNIQGFGQELNFDLQELDSILKSKVDMAPAVRAKIEEIFRVSIDESLTYISTSVSKMDSLLKGLLHLSRLERVEITFEHVEMNKLIGDVLETQEFVKAQAGVEISCDQLPPCYSDEDQLSHVFSNLIGNAIKYRHLERAGKIKITGCIKDGNSIYKVIDNGIGISPEHYDKIFEIYHRLNPTGVEGEGLGLSSVQTILTRLSGAIYVSSEVGVGSTFVVMLPCNKGEYIERKENESRN